MNSQRHVGVFSDLTPDVLVRDDEGLTKRLCRAEPDSRVFLHSSGGLAGDGNSTGVERAGDGRQERLVCAAWTNT